MAVVYISMCFMLMIRFTVYAGEMKKKKKKKKKKTNKQKTILTYLLRAGPRGTIGSPGLATRSGNILSFLLPLFQEGQLSVTGESVCTKYWLTA